MKLLCQVADTKPGVSWDRIERMLALDEPIKDIQESVSIILTQIIANFHVREASKNFECVLYWLVFQVSLRQKSLLLEYVIKEVSVFVL